MGSHPPVGSHRAGMKCASVLQHREIRQSHASPVTARLPIDTSQPIKDPGPNTTDCSGNRAPSQMALLMDAIVH
jgi:hypothetical protein